MMKWQHAADFHLQKNIVSPTVNIDILNGEQTCALGVNIGWGF